MNVDNKRSVCIYLLCNIHVLRAIFLKKKVGACVFSTPVFFLSLLAGKFCPFEQSAGVTQVMEIFKRSKMQIIQRQQTLNQRMCRWHKVRLSFFFSTCNQIMQFSSNSDLILL